MASTRLPAWPTNRRVTFLFTDIKDSSRMARAFGGSRYVEKLLMPHDTVLDTQVTAKRGRVFQRKGDGIIAVFEDAGQALACAVAIQESLAQADPPLTERDEGGRDWTVTVRMGLHTSRVPLKFVMSGANPAYDNPDDINFAARIESLADGGQIIVSQTTCDELGGCDGGRWKPWPNRYLKSFEDAPETVYEHLYDGPSRVEPGARWVPNWYVRELNKFVGREALLKDVRDWLTQSRYPLLTLHGFGGVGKTRAAIETVLGVSGLFPGGVAFVTLDRVVSGDPAKVTPGQLAGAVAEAVEAPDEVLHDPETRLADYLKSKKPLLLVLDNWESAGNTATLKWLGDLLQTVRPVRCLVTSRLAMGLSNWGDSRPVEPLAVPARETDRFAGFDGYKLFVERARQRRPDYTPADRAALVRVLQATEGFALGIELVAARAMEKTLLELAEGLEKSRLEWQRTREDLGDRRVDSSRHQSMEACIDWSVGLLPADEQRAFLRLFVFPGDFSAAAAQAVCDIPEDFLLRWHRAALVNQTEAGGRMRYTLLPVVREYAEKRVGEDGAGIRSNFVFHCYQIVNDNDDLNNAEHRATLDAELRNVLAAVETAEALQRWQFVLFLANLGGFLDLRGLWSEQARLYERTLTAAHKMGDKHGEGMTLNNLGVVYEHQNDLPRA